MPSPFPGMDPYLEDPINWPDAHHSLITTMREHLAAVLPAPFYVRIEDRPYVTHPLEDAGYPALIPGILLIPVVVTRNPAPSSIPSIPPGSPQITTPVVIESLVETEIHDAYLEIRDARSHQVVTAVELLSPANKVKGSRGRDAMLQKQRLLRQGGAHWLEIDLLRGGERLPGIAQRSDYCAILLRADRPGMQVWFIDLRDPLPTVAVPLVPTLPDVPLALQPVLDETYDRSWYAHSLDYARPIPLPALKPADAAWVADILERWRAVQAGE